MLFGCFHSAGGVPEFNLRTEGFSVVSVDQLANLHSVSPRYLVTSCVKVRRKKNPPKKTKKKAMEIIHLLCVVRLKTALLAPVNPNRACL